MSKEYNPVLDAKRVLKTHIQFFESLLQHLKGTNKVLRNRAVVATWCLHRYVDTKLIPEIQSVFDQSAKSAKDETFN